MKSASFLHLSTLDDCNILVWFVPGSTGIPNHLHNVHSANNLAKDNMFAVQKRSRRCGDKELASICVWPRVLRRFSLMLLILLKCGIAHSHT